MYERPVDVQKALKLNFGIEISLPGIIHYDVSNPELVKKWRALFNQAQNKFLKDASKIPISLKTYRLSKLQRLFDAEENESPRMQNKKAMRAILEQAAKESGDVFTNRRKHEQDGAGGKQLDCPSVTVNVVRSAEVVKDESEG
jgi:hypothetical protein